MTGSLSQSLHSTFDADGGGQCKPRANFPIQIQKKERLFHLKIIQRNNSLTWTPLSIGNSFLFSPRAMRIDTDVCTSPMSAWRVRQSARTSCGSQYGTYGMKLIFIRLGGWGG